MKGRTRLAIDAQRPLRHAIEIRHESFETPAFIDLQRDHGVAVVIAETARRWPMIEDITADFIYLRLHGDKVLYRGGTAPRPLIGGPRASPPGMRAGSHPMRARSSPSARRAGSGAMCTAFLITPM